MALESPFLSDPEHRLLVEEYHELESDQDRLSWLMERIPLHTEVPHELRTTERRVPGCLSGLWLHATLQGERCLFSACSESQMVQGIASYICDLYSNRTPGEILEMGTSLADTLGLERLLSTTRKRAVHSTVSYILYVARTESERNG